MNIRLYLALNAEVKTVWILTSAPPYILIETYFQSPRSCLIAWISHDSEPVLFLLYLYTEGNLLASKWRYRLYLPRGVGIFLILLVWGQYLEMTKSSSIPVLILSQYRIMFLFSSEWRHSYIAPYTIKSLNIFAVYLCWLVVSLRIGLLYS
jgi:hypothetical protein